MAHLRNGIFGVFSGKLGNLVGYTINGEPVLRTRGIITKPPSLAQLAVRQKIALLNALLCDILLFINAGFALQATGTTKNAFNIALSCNFKLAPTGEYPNITLDYSKLLVSKGSLPTAQNALANLLPNGVEFTWATDPGMVWGTGNDRAMLLIYFPQSKQNISILSGAQRREGRDFIPLDAALLSQPMQTYLAFASDNWTNVSDSVYAGQIG